MRLSSSEVPAGLGPQDIQSAYSLPAGGGAGQTIAILSAVVAVILTVKQKRSRQSLLVMVGIAVVISAAALGNIGSAGDLLLVRLDMVAEINQLNG
jgi:hypothetical protein